MRAPLAEAQAALRAGDPDTALALAARHGVPGHGGWALVRANALIPRGETVAAEAILRAAGAFMPARLRLIRMLMGAGRFAEARQEHGAAITLAKDARQLGRLFQTAGPLLGHGPAHAAATRQIAAQLATLPLVELTPAEHEAALRLRARLDFTLSDAVAFRASGRAALAAGADGALAPILAAALDPPATPRPRVFVVGLSKTGTTSMDHALGRLGFLHAHWAHPLTNLLLRPDDATLLEAMSDTPVSNAVETLAQRHPAARFILTLRPLASWLRSMTGHYGRHRGAPDMDSLRHLVTEPDRAPHGEAWRVVHRDLYTRHPDFPTAYAAHEARVEAVFHDAPNRILRFDVVSGDGYPKLCDFLGLAVPDEAYPHTNAAPAGS